jgi:hypothetical protein
MSDLPTTPEAPEAPEAATKKALWKRRPVQIAAGALVALGIAVSAANGGQTPEPAAVAPAVQEQLVDRPEPAVETPAPAVETPAPVAEAPAPAAEAPAPAAPDLTLGQKNAVAKAKSYLSFTGFSQQGLIEQLQFEGFSAEDATFGADNAGADWNAEAAQKAKSYTDMMAFSASGLSDQLVFDGFTPEQAAAGVASVGF